MCTRVPARLRPGNLNFPPNPPSQSECLLIYSYVRDINSFCLLLRMISTRIWLWQNPRPKWLGKKKFKKIFFNWPHIILRVFLIYHPDPLRAHGCIKIVQNIKKISNLQLFSCKFQKCPWLLFFLAVLLNFFSKSELFLFIYFYIFFTYKIDMKFLSKRFSLHYLINGWKKSRKHYGHRVPGDFYSILTVTVMFSGFFSAI